MVNNDWDKGVAVSDFKIGDRVEIQFHANTEYNGKIGKISFIGAGLMQGTNPLDYNIDIPDQESRFIVMLDDATIVDNVHMFQLRKV
jgi:hypothetical protein